MTSDLSVTGRDMFELRFCRAPDFAAASRLADRCAAFNDILANAEDEGVAEVGARASLAATWIVAAGRRPNALVLLFRWPTLARRERLARAVDASAGDRSLIEDVFENIASESWLITRAAASPGARERFGRSLPDEVHEMRIQKVLNGQTAVASRIQCDVDLPILVEHGADVLGCYELVIGPDRPVLITIVRWRAFEDQQNARRSFDQDARIIRQRERESRQYSRRLFGPVEHYVLVPH